MDFKNSQDKSQRGQSMVEFAFGMVVVMILMAGVVDGARALFTYMALRDAAQEGAIYGSTEPADTAGITERVNISSEYAKDMSSSGDMTVQISYTDTAGNTKTSLICLGDGVTVTVSYPQFPLTMPFLGAFIGQQWVPISASITDTVLRPPCGP
jgi:Flp pilus assembly protein TadG